MSVLRATLLVVLSSCCFGSIAPLTVIGTRSGASLPSVQAMRYVTAALLLSAYAWWRDSRNAHAQHLAQPSDNRYAWWHPRILLIAGGGQGSVAGLSLSSLSFIPAATVGFLFYTFPAWVAVITAVRGIEPMTKRRVLALTFALGGIAMMVGAPSSGGMHPTGVALALGAALVYAVYIPVLAWLQNGYSGLNLARAISTGGSVVFITWSLLGGSPFANHDAVSVACGVLQGVLTTGAFLGFLAGLARLGAVKTAITCTVEPFWTAMLSVVMLDQPLGPGTVVGGVGIIAAVALLQDKS